MTKGRYSAYLISGEGEIADAVALRVLAFGPPGGSDEFDPLCTHLLIRLEQSGTLVCCLRMLALANGGEAKRSYSAQFYDLSRLAQLAAPMFEIGRFCIHPDWHDPDILRIAWGAITRFVDKRGAAFLFGCSSFSGVDPTPYLDAFSVLKARHLAPLALRPGVKWPDPFRFAAELQCRPDPRSAAAQMPPLLRSYLLMGGQVSDHAVIDWHMNTLHVFTMLEIAAIPPARKRLLRTIAASH
nr:GNAT family N-acetyltransferase [Pontibaca salina]